METLPPQVARQSVLRLRRLSGAVAIIGPGSAVVRYVLFEIGVPLPPEMVTVGGVMSVVAGILGLAMYLISRSSLPSDHILRLALVFEVVLVLIAVMFDRRLFQFGEPPLRVSIAVAISALFPVVVPVPFRWRLITTIASIAMMPLGVWLLAKLGVRPYPDPTFLEIAYVPTALVAFLAVGASRIVHGLVEQVSKAQRMGSYELVERLGGGGMGDVWLARHHMLVHPAAIKLIKADRLGADRAQSVLRFEREAQATASLRSPHTVDLYDFGVADDGTFYYVMELLDGTDLDRLVTKFGPLPAERVIYILAQVCRSLADAELRGLVHRDIKPANVFLCRLGYEVDFVKVLDFGLVKPSTDGPQDVKLSADNLAVGTPAFMPPELALGRPVDRRTDLYALGCVAYWLLTGELVFKGATPLEIVMEHVKTDPPPPSSRSELPIPPALDAIVLDCLKKAPDDRPSSAAELMSRLEAVGLPESWTEDRARQWWQVHGPAIHPAPG